MRDGKMLGHHIMDCYHKTPRKFGYQTHYCNCPKISQKLMHPKDADRTTNSEDPYQTTHLGLHCLLRSVCLKIQHHYSRV